MVFFGDYSVADAAIAPVATRVPAIANDPNTFNRWHFFNTARYLFIKFPIAPFDIINFAPKNLSFQISGMSCRAFIKLKRKPARLQQYLTPCDPQETD